MNEEQIQTGSAQKVAELMARVNGMSTHIDRLHTLKAGLDRMLKRVRQEQPPEDVETKSMEQEADPTTLFELLNNKNETIEHLLNKIKCTMEALEDYI